MQVGQPLANAGFYIALELVVREGLLCVRQRKRLGDLSQAAHRAHCRACPVRVVPYAVWLAQGSPTRPRVLENGRNDLQGLEAVAEDGVQSERSDDTRILGDLLVACPKRSSS